MFLFDVIKALEKEKVKYAVVGGYALALHGIVRATIDVDLLVSLNLKDLSAAEKAMNNLGLTSRIPVSAKEIIDFRAEYIEKRNLLAWSFVDYKDPSKIVDILIVTGLSEVETVRINVSGKKISVVSLEDLKKMKTGTGRAKDALDIESINEKLENEKR
jgi:hypothetical protein